MVLPCVKMCFFSVHFSDILLVLSCDRTNLLKWLMWSSNRSASNSASDSAKWEQEHTKCLQKHLVIKPWAKRQPTNGFSVSRMDGCQPMMSVLNDIKPEPWPKMYKKCKRLSWKTGDEWLKMFATMLDCCVECASEFCHTSSTRSPMQQNMCQGWWAVIKRKYALLSVLSWKRPLLFTIPKDETEDQGAMFLQHWRDPDWIIGWMKILSQNEFQLCFQSWKSRWDPYINIQRDYFEGGGGE